MDWEKAPGGKRYVARHEGRVYRVVRQNTAAGAKRWMTTVEVPGASTIVLARTDSFVDAKRAADQAANDQIGGE